MPIAIIILLISLTAIALRKAIPIPMPIWLIMTLGAMLMLLFQQITLRHAIAAINPDIIIYLLGVFLICQAAEACGYLEHVTDRIFYSVRCGSQALAIIVFVLGCSAAVFMNDTIAIVGTPIILQLCKSNKRLIKPLLLALAYAVTIGSVVSPVGNPQNLLIAVKGDIASPFFSFIKYLGIPTLINLVVAYFFIYFSFRKILTAPIAKPVPKAVNDLRTVFLVKLSLCLMLALLTIKIIGDLILPSFMINFSYIAIIAAVPILFSQRRWNYLKSLDWGTLLFFVSTFIVMQSVWDSGFFQENIRNFHIAVAHTPVILMLSIFLSQFISNVPLVALYLPLLLHHKVAVTHLLALAAGSTIAGNLSIFGAASNIIIVQNSEKRGYAAFGFFEFIKYGAILTLINIIIYAYFL